MGVVRKREVQVWIILSAAGKFNDAGSVRLTPRLKAAFGDAPCLAPYICRPDEGGSGPAGVGGNTRTVVERPLVISAPGRTLLMVTDDHELEAQTCDPAHSALDLP